MNPQFTSWKEALDEHRYQQPLADLPAMVRLAQTPAEWLLAARTAGLAMLPGLELRLLRRATRATDCPPAGHLALAALYISSGRYLEAEEMLSPRLEDPAWETVDQARVLTLLAVSLAGRRRFRSAEGLLAGAEALMAEVGPTADPDRDVSLDLTFARLSLHYFADRWEAAEAELAAQVAAGADESRSYLLLAQCREHLGRPAEALEALQAGCRRLPEHPYLWATLASAAWASDDVDLALEANARCTALLPHARGRRQAERFRRWCADRPVRLPVPPVRQAYNHCFPACLAMVMGYWCRPVDHRRLGQAIMDDTRGTPLFRALHHLEAEGWAVRAFRAAPDRLKALIDAGVPAILGLEFAGGAHVHICTGYDDETLLLQDPVSIRPRRIRLIHFAQAYAHSDYWALAFVPADAAGRLEALPESDDRQIRLMQQCWEALHYADWKSARSAFADLEAEPPSVGLQLFRLRTWPQLGTREAALHALEELLSAFPDHREIRLELARHLERLGLTDRAVALAEEESDRWSVSALLIRGRAARLKSAAQAAGLFRLAAIADPQSTEPVAEWGRSEAELGHFDRAEALFAAACEMDPSLGNPLDWLCSAASRLEAPEPALRYLEERVRTSPTPSLCWQLAHLWLRVNPGQAMGWAETALVADGRTPEAQVKFGEVALAAGRENEARWAFEGAIGSTAAPLPRASYGLARLAQKAEQPEQYREHMQHAIVGATDAEEIQHYADQLADHLEEQKNWDAVSLLLEGIKGRVDEAWRLTYLGYVAEQSKGAAEALPLYDAALDLDPEHLWARYRRPLALLELDRTEEALQEAEQTAARWPDKNGLVWVLGRCQHALEQNEAALQTYLRAFDLDPDWGPVHRSLFLLLGSSEWDRIVTLLGQLEGRRQAALLESFGNFWSEAGQVVRARQAWDRATDLAPEMADPYIHLAESHLQDERPALAWEVTIPFLAHNPAEAVPFAVWLAEKTPAADVAAALTRAVPGVGDAFRLQRANLWWVLGESRDQLGLNDKALEAWQHALTDDPAHRGALWRVCRHYDRWQRSDDLLALLTPLEEAGTFPADQPFMAVWYLRAALRQNRSRRPHWRRWIIDRVAAIARTQEAEPREVENLQELYERLELEFGNRRAAWNAGILKDELANWLRVLCRSVLLRLRRPPLDVRPGESAGPATRRPLLPWEDVTHSGWGWVKRNPLTVTLMALCLILALAAAASQPHEPSSVPAAARAPRDDAASPLRIAGPLVALATLVTSRWIGRRRT